MASRGGGGRMDDHSTAKATALVEEQRALTRLGLLDEQYFAPRWADAGPSALWAYCPLAEI